MNEVAAQAIDHGIILSNSSTDYGTWSRRAQTSHHMRMGKAPPQTSSWIVNWKGEPTDHEVGVQAFLAIRRCAEGGRLRPGRMVPGH